MYSKCIAFGVIVSLSLSLIHCKSNTKKFEGDYYVPTTISPEAQEVVRKFKIKERQFPEIEDLEGWKRLWADNEQKWMALNDSVAGIFQPSITEDTLGGIPVLDIKPKNWNNNGKILIYVHGGGYALFSARTMLIGAVPVADRTGLRIISVSYTNPPFAKYNTLPDQIIAVIKAVLEMGYTLADIGVYGDSAGGGLIAGSVLKMRDDGLGMPAAVVLISPWSDITNEGDTYETLRDADPILSYEQALYYSSYAYAPDGHRKDPYVSPVYADYSKGFPPTLIQGGTKEIFLSNFVRQYQAIDAAGIYVKLDLYEGMWHVFQEINFDLPESVLAHQKMGAFFKEYLGY